MTRPPQPLQLLKRLWQQEQYLRVRIETERDSEVRAAGLGQPVLVAYHRQMITRHESELGVLKWFIEAAQEQEAELAALRAQAEVGKDTPESVNEAVRAANNTTGRPRPLPKEEDAARFDVIQLGRAYGLALKAAAELPEVRTAFHNAQARLAAALAQAEVGDREMQVIAWGLETQVVYVGPRPDAYPNMGALRVIPSAHGHLTRVTDGRAEFSAPHAHFASAQADAEGED